MNIDELRRNIEDNANKRVDTSPLYSPWGDQALTARQQGWYPAVPMNDVVEYRSDYKSPFETINIPGQDKPGHVVLVGGYSGKFDVQIRDAQGKTRETIFKSITPQQVQNWITDYGNTVGSRVTALKGTNQQFVVK